MEVAIRTSTIIAALLSAIVKAKLVFFNNTNMDIDKIPQNIEEVSTQGLTRFIRTLRGLVSGG